MTRYQPTDPVTSLDEVFAVMPPPNATQEAKFLDHIDDLVAAWIARSTFLAMATYDAKGRVDVSPKGDPAGFVQVLDRHTLAIPDRPGNHRYDSFANIMATGRIGLVFLVPHRNEVVRVNGRAQVVRDAEIRERCAIKGRVPDFAVLTHVEEAFYHCGKAIIRSRLWHPADHATPDNLPTYAQALLAHAETGIPLADMEAHLKNNDENRLYDE